MLSMKRFYTIVTIIIMVAIAVLSVSGCSYDNQDSANVEDANTPDQSVSVITPGQFDATQLSVGILPGYEKYPMSFSIFCAYANHALPLDWSNVKSFLTDAGYSLWHPVDDDESSGFMLLPNREDEQEFYFELATLYGGMSNEGTEVELLMYQLNTDTDCVIVSFENGGERYTIRDYTYTDDGLETDEWEVSTLDELVAYAVNALDEVYERIFIS